MMAKEMSGRLWRAGAALLALLLVLVSAFADSGPNHRVGSNQFGTSGGNVNDSSSAFCCSGTLGSLVSDGVTEYILSNNHVLARTNSAAAGEDISQPGLVDNFCQVPPIVADLTAYPLLSSNVDAAIAQLRTGAMDSAGTIMDIGIPSSVIQAPSINLAVQKSGRTSGHTTGTIGSINTNVNVQYQQRCGQGKKFTVSYRNQVVINSSTFSAGGDSGSLILTADSTLTNQHPVALLFAGSSSTTVANPIGDVLTQVSQALKRCVSFALPPNTCVTATQTTTPQTQISPRSTQQANTAKERWADEFMNRPGVIGVGVGSSEDGTEGAVVVYVDNTISQRPNLPSQVDGVTVRVVFTDPFVSR